MQSFSSIDVKGIKVDNVVTLKDNHGLLIKLVQSNGKPITYQTPLMNLAWSAQVRLQEKGATSCNLPLSFSSTNKDVLEFKAWLGALRDQVKAIIKPNTMAWYGSPLTDGQIDDYLSPLIKPPPPDTAYAPVFLPRLAHTENSSGGYTVTVKAFGVDKKEMDPEVALKKGNRVGAIVNVAYIHVGKGNKQLSLRSDVTQCLVLPIANEQVFSFDLNSDPALVEAAEEAEKKKAQEAEAAKTAASSSPADEDDRVAKRARAGEYVMAEYDDRDDV